MSNSIRGRMERKQENDEDEKDILLLGYAPFYVLGRKKERKKKRRRG